MGMESHPVVVGGGVGDQVFVYSNPTLFMGTTTNPVSTLVMGNGDTAVTPAAKVIRFTNASGTDNAAGNATIRAPLSTGNATPASVIIQVGVQVAGSSAVLQTAGNAVVFSHTTAGGHSAVFGGSTTVGSLIMGVVPPSTLAAIRVDANGFASDIVVGISFSTTTLRARISMSSTDMVIGGETARALTLRANAMSKWRVVDDAAGTATLSSYEATARIVMGATNGIAFRNAANSADRFTINDAGSSVVINNGTQVGIIGVNVAAGELFAGVRLQGGAATMYATVQAPNQATGGIAGAYYNSTDALFRSAFEVNNLTGAGLFGTLALMKSGGNVVIGGTAAGATASGVLAFGTAAGTSPSATVDLVHLYGLDISAGNRALAVWQEAAPNAAVAVVSTHGMLCTINGTQYRILLTTVLA